MTKFREFLNEGKETATAIREILKKDFKLTSKDVGVTVKDAGYSSAVQLKIKTIAAYAVKKELNDLSNKFEQYTRDSASGEILLGGNTYVLVSVDSKLQGTLYKNLLSELDEEKLQNGEVKNLYGKIDVDFRNNEYYIYGKESKTLKTTNYFNEVPNLILQVIQTLKNPLDVFKKI